ncbi:MAG: hypothetical protein ACI4XE_06800 [Acutalibacteraceae bacterium]
MKLAYRIVTPIIAVVSVVLGIFLKMFYFTVGNADETIGNLINAIASLTDKFSTTFEYSIYDLLKMISNVQPQTGEDAKTFTEVAAPIIAHLWAFFIIFVVALLVTIAVGIISTLPDSKKKRYTVIGLCAGGLVLLFVDILVSNAAFAKITNGEIDLTELVSVLSDSSIAALATAILTVTSASLSAGFYSVFGLFILIILWTVLSNMLISTPIQKAKTHKRKKPMKRIMVKAKKN